MPTFDSVTATGLFTDTKTQAHTPVGTPRGVLVLIAQGDVTADQISGVTYGGVSMTEVTGSPLVPSSPLETGAVYGYYLGSSIPTGTQNCVITCSANTADKHAAVITYTAAADTAVHVTGTIEESSSSDVTDTLALGGVTCAVALAAYGTENAPGNLAPLSGWGTNVNTTADYGSQSGCIYSYDTVGSSDVTYGVNDSIAGIYVLAVAIKESAASGVTGTGALTTGTTTASGTGVLSHTGTGGATTSAVTASGTGTLAHTGTGGLTVGATTLDGNGTVSAAGSITGSGSVTVGAVTASGSGVLTHTGTGAATVGNITASGAGTLAHTGTGDLDTNAASLSASGFLGSGITGTGSLTIGNIEVSGTGTWFGWAPQGGASGTWADAANTSDIWTPAAATYGTWDNL